MPDTTTQAGVVLFTLVAAFALCSGIRKTMRHRDEWSMGALVGICIVMVTFIVVPLLATYTNSWVKVTDVFRNVSYEVPTWGQMSLRVLLMLLIVGGIAVFVTGMRRRDAQVNVAAVFLVIVMFISMGSSLQHGDIPFQWFSVVYLCLLAACIFAPRGLSIDLGIATVSVVVAIASGIALVARKEFSVFECVAGHKCGVLGFNFRGVLDNENAIALYLALAMPFVCIAFRGWQGLVMSAYLTALILLTGSRSGTLAAVVTFAVLVLVRPDLHRRNRTPARSALLSCLLLGTFATGLVLPFVVDDPSQFSGRAALWQLARNGLSDPVTLAYGTGMFGWNHVHEAGLIDASAVYSVHNQWLHILFSTGIIGLLFFLGAIAILLWQARGGYFAVMACVLVPYFFLAITERPWPIDTGDWLSWSVPGALLCYPVMRGRTLPNTRDSTPTVARNAEPMTVGGPSSRALEEEGRGW